MRRARSPHPMPPHPRLLPPLLLAASGLLVGLDTGLVAEALTPLSRAFHMGVSAREQVVAVLMIGAAAAAWFAGPFARAVGRRMVFRAAVALAMAGGAICAVAGALPWFVFGRLVMGGAIGTFAFLAPLFIAELSPDRLRGRMIATYSLLQSCGILAGYALGAWLAETGQWRLIVGAPVMPALVLLMVSRILPESPVWLAERGRHDEARRVLTLLHGDPDLATGELAAIERQLTAGERRVPPSAARFWRKNPFFRRSVALGIGLQIAQQFAGINFVLYYAPEIAFRAGVGPASALWVPVVIGVVNAAIGGVATVLADRVGRRWLLGASFALMAASLLGAGLSAAFSLGAVPVISCLLLFVAGFGLGAGPVVWLLCSEIQPEEGREFGVACSTLANWVADWVVSALSLTLIAAFGLSSTLMAFGALNAAFVILTCVFVPETRGVPLPEIERRLRAGGRLRRIGRVATAVTLDGPRPAVPDR